MDTAKAIIHRIIDEIPENQLISLLEYAVFVKQRSNVASFDDLTEASRSGLDFWDNPIDDEVWNNV